MAHKPRLPPGYATDRQEEEEGPPPGGGAAGQVVGDGKQ